MRPTALEARARSGDAAAARALLVIGQLDAYLTATQLGVTLASLGLGWLGEPAIARGLGPVLQQTGLSERAVHGVSAAVAFAVISVLHIVIGELIPKSLAIQKPEDVTRFTAVPLRFFYFGMYPVLFVLNRLSIFLLRKAGVEPGSEVATRHTADEIRLIVEASFAHDGADRLKRDLLERVLRATDRPVRAIMVPRVDMYTLSLDASLDTWRADVRKLGFSRYPVTEGSNPDRVVGYIYVKDLLLLEGQARGGSRALTRDILFVPGTLSVGKLLTRFQRSNIPIAIVVDEYGGTAGLVTVEDVVEELVGDLRDELDVSVPEMEQREDGTLIVAGTLAVGDLPIGIGGDVVPRDKTISGYIIEALGRLAHPGDRIQIGGYEAVVEDVRRRRIWRVALRPHQPSTRPVSSPPTTPE